jgi:hypothetical protein
MLLGRSLVPAMADGAHVSNYSFSQFAKSGKDVATAFDTCMGCHPSGPAAADFMGSSRPPRDSDPQELFLGPKKHLLS